MILRNSRMKDGFRMGLAYNGNHPSFSLSAAGMRVSKQSLHFGHVSTIGL